MNDEQEELYEGRLSHTVLWEREGETPARDLTIQNPLAIIVMKNAH